MRKILWVFVLTLAGSLVPAMADIQLVGDPVATNSWYQTFRATGSYTKLEVQMTSEEDEFKDPVFTNQLNVVPTEWLVLVGTPTQASASLSSGSNFIFRIHFENDESNPLTFNLRATRLDGTAEAKEFDYQGFVGPDWVPTWCVTDIQTPVPTVPEPAAGLLLGLMGALGLGVPGWLKRKLS